MPAEQRVIFDLVGFTHFYSISLSPENMKNIYVIF